MEAVEKLPSIIIAGGGAAGFFAAITAAEANPSASVVILEQTAHFLTKVARSGGGRCNVTHACFEPRVLAGSYPRGERPLIGPLNRFAPQDTIDWFEKRGVPLKAENDGRIFPGSNSSASIVDCLLHAARTAGVQLIARTPVQSVRFCDDSFVVQTPAAEYRGSRVLLATGGTRVPAGARIAESFGHRPIAPVPSLFTFDVSEAWVHELAGLSVEVEVSVVGASMRQRGPLLFTHRGVSGPAVLKLSAWGARLLAELDYHFAIRINFLPGSDRGSADSALQAKRAAEPSRKVMNSPVCGVPARLWTALCGISGIDTETRWSNLSRVHRQQLAVSLTGTELPVGGKSLNKDEFVTCGGIPAAEIDFKTMESRLRPGLHFAGELIDIYGITGGFNFQAAWTTGWLAGHAMAGASEDAASLVSKSDRL